MLWMGIWVHHYSVLHVQVGVSFRENGVWPSLYDIVVSWLRLQTPIDCIPHPYWMYTKCFSTLRCCGWAYGYILLAVIHVQVGVNFKEMGYGWDCIMLWFHGWGHKPPLNDSHIHIECIQSVLAPWDDVDGHMGAPLCRTITCAGGGEFQGKRGMTEPVWCCGVMVEANSLH